MQNPMKNGFEVDRFKPADLLKNATHIIAVANRFMTFPRVLCLAAFAGALVAVLLPNGGTI